MLFKRSGSPQGSGGGEWLEDYDYVNLESKEAVAKKHAEIRDALPHELKIGYDNLVKNVDYAALGSEKADILGPDDKQVSAYFSISNMYPLRQHHYKHLRKKQGNN